MKLEADFYAHNAVELAPMLLGKRLCRRLPDDRVVSLRITETEAYFGMDDTACHARNGKTERNAPMFMRGGAIYVYLCYGIHNLLNIVSGDEEHPEAVLIRGVEGFSGPGKLTKAMSIGRDLSGKNLFGDELWLEDDGFLSKYDAAPRIGIDYASEEYRLKPWRFIAKL